MIMVTIRGTIVKGKGEGKNTLREQMPLFKPCFPEVADCRPATLNIRLDKPLVVLSADFTTPSLPWHPALKLAKSGESFQFVRITLTLDGGKPVKAWIYRAQFSPYRNDPFFLEVLAPPLDFAGLPGCTIEVPCRCYEGLIVAAETTPVPAPKRAT